MGQSLVLYLIIIQILSIVFGTEVFNELLIARECFPPNSSDPNYPTCNFFISANVSTELTSKCVKEMDMSVPALRIVGEFRLLKIKCTASYPIDFRYYGIQPTEAILIDWYKGVQLNSDKSNQNFTVEVTVHSVQELFEFYNDEKNSFYETTEKFQTVHDYSRTGSYEFHGIFNKTIGTSFYIFLEDDAKPSFLRNAKTVPRFSGNKIIIPCIPSHFDSEVELTQVPSAVNKRNNFIVKNRIDGFIIQSIGNDKASYYGNYQCTLKHKGEYIERINLEYANSTEISDKLFGLETFNFKEGDNLDVSGEPIIQGDFVKYIKPFCKTRSPSDPVDTEKLQLISVPVYNFGYMRLVQQFAIPKFFNRSYTARMVNSETGGWSSLVRQIQQPIGNLHRMGTLYCTTGHLAKIVDFGSTIRGHVIPFDYAKDWALFNRKTSDVKFHFGLDILNESRPLYAGTIISFACRINIPVVVLPIVWYTERVNGTRVEEKVDYDLSGLYDDTAVWSANLSVDVNKVICTASYWYSDWWREIPLSFKLQEIVKPIIRQVETVRTFQSGSKGVTIECTAWGNPKPTVYFEKNGLRLYTLSSGNGTVLIFDKFDSENEGTYTCVANNGYETRQDYFIAVKSGDFDPMVIVIPVVVFCLTVLAAAVYIKFFRPARTGLTQEEINEFLKGMKREQIPDGDEDYAHGFASMTSYKTEYEIPPDRFVVEEDRVLGNGAFGIVTLGKVDHRTVAVKTTQKHAEKQYLKALLSELKIMIYLGSHPNLVQIVGAYTKDLNKGIVYVFVEYVSLGNLQTYLRKNKDVSKLPALKDGRKQNEYCNSNMSSVQSTGSEYKNTTSLTVHSFWQWSKQIADGMDYLGSKKVIHGDLATRNVLLDDNLNAKITDFGLSRQLYDYHDYIKKQQEPLPWRWMALESLKFMTFSTASDVWAFGITVWEIYSLGELPYPGYTWTLDFVTELDNGLRMGRPKYGSDQLFAIISQCWNEDPEKRPSFKLLKLQLDELDVPPS